MIFITGFSVLTPSKGLVLWVILAVVSIFYFIAKRKNKNNNQ